MAATLPFVSNHMWYTITHRILGDPHVRVPLLIALHIRWPHVNERLHSRVIHPNEIVGAVPVCPPERPRSGVSIPKTYALCAETNDGCVLTGRHGRAHRHRPYQSPLYICAQSHTNKITIYTQSTQTKSTIPRAICPNETNRPTRNLPNRHQLPTRYLPKRNRRGGACVPARTSAQRRFHTENTRIVRGDLMTDAPFWGDTGGHIGAAPTHLHHIFPRNSTQTKFRPCVIHPKRNQPSMCNPPKRNRRGGACVPARTSAQRRFYAKNIRIVCGKFNDGCALVGRHGRAHRHRPYQSPPNYAVCHYLITLYIR